MTDIGQWLREHDLGKFEEIFSENEIDLDVLQELTDADLKDIGLPLGPRKKLLKAIRELEHTPKPSRAYGGEAERRQLTVMFADLVGSVALGENMDVEDYRDLLGRFRDAVVGAVESFQGFIARHQGDGLLVYFGYPQAHEDDAERAVRAGLEVTRAIEDLEHPYDVQPRVRVGIATGIAVVGDVLSTDASEHSELAALGPTPNLAARLQGEAEPNRVVISETTYDLVSGYFSVGALPVRELKGIPGRVTAYLVEGELSGQSRFSARAGIRLSPFVGREEEMELLRRRWGRARAGDGQATLIVGEAGMGKSRLLEQLRSELSKHPHNTLLLQCSPFLTNSALHPVIGYLNQALKSESEASSHDRLSQLEIWLSRQGISSDEATGFLADLLAIPSKGRFPAVETLEAQQRRERILHTLVDTVKTLAEKAPVLCAFEDVHWADPSTGELLGQLVEAIDDARVLVIATTRPGYEARWSDLAHVHVLNLSRLGRSEGEKLTQSVAATLSALPPKIVRDIVSRAGGNPLFIEELTRTVVQSGTGSPSDVELAIPSTLQDSLTARLDVLSFGKAVAQCASVVGREFEYAVLTKIWDGTSDELGIGLNELEGDGLLHRRGEEESVRYQFKHALIQDAAYDSLLRDRRHALHEQVAIALQECHPETNLTQPELLARHYTEAGQPREALPFWDRAGERAVSTAALEEAIEHYQHGIEAADALDDEVDSIAAGVRLRISLAGCLRTVERSDEAFALLNEAERAATRHELYEELARIHHMLGNLYFLADGERCLEHHGKSLDYARKAGALKAEALALGGQGDAHYMLGTPHTSWRHYMDCIEICRREDFAGIEAAHLPNLAMCERFFLAFDDATEHLHRAIDLAQVAGNPRAELVAYGIASNVYLDKGDLEMALKMARKRTDMARKVGASRFVSGGLFSLSGVALARGDSDEAARFLREALTIAENTSLTFSGPQIFGRLLLVTDDQEQRQAYLARGEKLLQQLSLLHNHMDFYRDTTEAALKYKHWADVERFAHALSDYAKDGLLRWADFYAARGRALARFGAGDRSEEVLLELGRLRSEVESTGLRIALPAIEQALRSMSQP